MIGKFLANLGWTRDDWKLVWAQVVFGAGLVLQGVFDIHQFALDYFGLNISAREIRWFMLLCGIVTWIAAKQGNSGLPGKNDPPAGSVSSVRKVAPMVILAVALGGAALTSTGCAGKTAPVLTPTQAQQALAAVKKVGDAVAVAQDTEIAFYNAGDIPPDVHKKIQKAFEKASAAVQTALDAFNQAGTGNTHDLVLAVRDAAKSLMATFADLSAQQSAKLSAALNLAASAIDLALAS